MSTCSGLSALDHANSKHSKGYATTGIVCTTCRHEFILPEGAGPLQKGERSVSNWLSSVDATEPRGTGTLTLTMWSFEAHPTTPRLRRWPLTMSCVNILSISEAVSRISPSRTRSACIAKSWLALFRNFIWPLTRNPAGSISLSITNPALGAVIWKVRRGPGSASKEEGPRRTRDLVTGVTLWMINLATGTGPNLSALVGFVDRSVSQ